MKGSLLAALLAAIVALTGCRTDPRIALLERELREQEDEIYRLEAELEDYDKAFAQADSQRAALEEALCARQEEAEEEAEPARDVAPPDRQPPADRPARSAAPLRENLPEPGPELSLPTGKPSDGAIPSPRPRTSFPPPLPPSAQSTPETKKPSSQKTPFDIDPGALRPPEVEMPAEGQSEPPPIIQTPQRTREPRLEEVPTPLPLEKVSQSHATLLPAGSPRKVSSSKVTEVVLDRAGCGGFDTDNLPGDEGIAVLVQPRDASGVPVEAPAAVSITVIDPTIPGEAATIGRWDFTEAELTRSFRNSSDLTGHPLEMLWPGGSPRHGDLQVLVEYNTEDGRTLQAEGWITVALPGQQSTRWVPVAPRDTQPAQVATRPAPARDPAVRPASGTEPLPDAPAGSRPRWSPDRE